MTPEQQEILYAAHAAKAAGFKLVEIAPEDLIALFDEMRAAQKDAMRNFGELEQAMERIALLERENAELRDTGRGPRARDHVVAVNESDTVCGYYGCRLSKDGGRDPDGGW